MSKFEILAKKTIEFKRILEKEIELNEEIKNLTETITLTKDSYQEQKNLYIEAGYLTHTKIQLLKELNNLGLMSYENLIKEAENYLTLLLDSLIDLDKQYKKARDIVKITKCIDKNSPEYSLLDIEFDY